MKILIVDDAAFMRQLLKNALTKHGHECFDVGSGHEALAAYPSLRPDVITMDITMPEMDGIATLKELRQRHPEARVVMCSAMGQETLVLEAIAAGALDFVIKPFRSERVIEALEKAAAVGID